jgi:DNA polymerase
MNNPSNARVLAEMGIKPVWRLREGMAALQSAPAMSEHVVELVSSDEPSSSPVLAELDWSGLERAVTGVLGAGDRQAEWMFVGHASSADEDQSGDLFVGNEGLLLNAMLAAIKLQRGKNVYLTHALKRHLPAEGVADAAQIETYRPYLARQIALVKPKVLVAFGVVAAQSLLGKAVSMSDAHGKVFRYGDTPVIVCDHPADLLRQPLLKASAWAALCLAMDQIAAS